MQNQSANSALWQDLKVQILHFEKGADAVRFRYIRAITKYGKNQNAAKKALNPTLVSLFLRSY